MQESYPVEFRMRAIALVRAAESIAGTAQKLSISKACLHTWVKQVRIDPGQVHGQASKDHTDLASARRRIRELEIEIAIIRWVSEIFKELNPRP